MAIDVNIPSQVKTYANLAAFPATGTLKTIFIAEDTNKTYRWTGTAYVEVSAAGASGITIGTTAITSGTVGRVLFEGTGNVVQESANLFWDNTNGRLGIGGTPSTFNLDVVGTARVQGNTTISLNQNGVTLINASNTTSGTASTAELRATTGGGFIGLGKYSASTNSYKFIASSDSYLYSATIGDIAIINDFASGRIKFGAGASSTAQATLFSTGNFAINTTTDAGFKLDVNGTARVQTSIVINGSASLLSSSLSIYQNSTNRAFSLATSTTKTSAAERILFSLNSNDATNQQAMDFGYIGATLINDRYFYLQTSESSVGYGGGLVMQQNGGWASVGSATQVPSSVFHITSTTKGFLPPRMTTTQKNAIASPVAGLIVYDSTLNKLCLRTASAWETITSL